jgi:hypothetical protein
MEPRSVMAQFRWTCDSGQKGAADASAMEPGGNLLAGCLGVASKAMSPATLEAQRQLRRPAGCEGHLTRRQAAAVLGFASEFKIREFERQGLLRSVRGPMRAAFYPRPEVLALKARLAQCEARPCPPEDWTDADLIALLEHPTPAGPARTALDLVTETRIGIERAERVVDFWTRTPRKLRRRKNGAARKGFRATTSSRPCVVPTRTSDGRPLRSCAKAGTEPSSPSDHLRRE